MKRKEHNHNGRTDGCTHTISLKLYSSDVGKGRGIYWGRAEDDEGVSSLNNTIWFDPLQIFCLYEYITQSCLRVMLKN